MSGILKALLPLIGEGIKEGAKALVSWARTKREKRESDLEYWRSIQKRHVPRPPRQDDGK